MRTSLIQTGLTDILCGSLPQRKLSKFCRRFRLPFLKHTWGQLISSSFPHLTAHQQILVTQEYMISQDSTLVLLEKREGEVVAVRHRKAWILVDNGNLKWAVPPIREQYVMCHRLILFFPLYIWPLHQFYSQHTLDEQRWSNWPESMRKVVECSFVIL